MYKKTKSSQVPKSTRARPSRFESTSEWAAMKADMDKGLKPDEALQVTLTDAERAKYNIRGKHTVPRFLRAYIESKKLPLTVRKMERPGSLLVIVERK